MSPSLGQSFFSPEGSQVRRHLWVVVSDPSRSDAVVIVNLSTHPGPVLGGGSDPRAPEVQPSEHPSLSQTSFIRYEQARITRAQAIDEGLKKKVLSATKDAPAALVRKLQRALAASEHTRNDIKDLLRGQGVPPCAD